MWWKCCGGTRAVHGDEYIDDRFKALQEENKVLRSTLLRKMDKRTLNREIQRTAVDQSAVAAFVDSLIKDEHVNINGLPDAIERRLYVNVFGMILNLLNDCMSNVKIDVIGQRIELKMSRAD